MVLVPVTPIALFSIAYAELDGLGLLGALLLLVIIGGLFAVRLLAIRLLFLADKLVLVVFVVLSHANLTFFAADGVLRRLLTDIARFIAAIVRV